MKTAKRLLCILMAMAMLLALALPANAAKPAFTKQPGSPGTVMCGQNFTLSVAAKGATRYRWFVEYGTNYTKRNYSGNSSTLTTSVRERDFPLFDVKQVCYYRCEASNADGKITSATSTVVAWLNPWQAFVHGIMILPNYIINIPRLNLGDITAYTNWLLLLMPVLFPMALPILIPIAPIYLPIRAAIGMLTGR